MPYIESFNEFDARQKCPYIQVGNKSVWENGAQASVADPKWRQDPPTDEVALLHWKLVYAHAMVDRAHGRLDHFKANVNQQALIQQLNAGPSAEMVYPGWEKEVERLALVVQQLQEKREKLHKEWSKKIPPDVRQEMYMENKEESARTMQKLRALPY